MILRLRKKRNDRNYILYELRVDNQTYIGLTVAVGRAFLKSVKIRVQKHISRALVENKDWTLCKAIQEADTIQYSVIEVIRGRKAAYSRERELIAEYSPELNDF